MRFKSCWRRTLVLISVFILSCAGENEFSISPPKVKFDSPKFNCLSRADETLFSYLNGDLKVSEVQAFWNCLDLAVVQFVKFVRGSEGQTYTPREMAQFLDTYFLDNKGLANETHFLSEFMQIKRLFVGGAVDRVTHHDLFVRTRELIQEFKAMTVSLNPHMKTLSKGLKPSDQDVLARRDVNAALEALQVATRHLASLLKEEDQLYSFSHLKAFLTDLESFLQRSTPKFSLTDTLRYLPLLGELKGMIVAPPHDLIRHADWGRLLDSVGSILSWVVRYNLDIRKKDWSSGVGFEAISVIATEILNELEKGLQRQDKNEVSFVDLDRLIEMLEHLELLPLELNANEAKQLLRRVLEKVLDPAGGLSHGLNLGDIQALRSEVQRWIEAQNFLNQISMSKRVDEFIFGDIETSGADEEMRLLMRTKWPLIRDQVGRLRFSADVFNGKYDQISLSTLNWQRALVRALMRSYGSQASPDGARGLSREELTVLFRDWSLLAEKFGLFDPGQSEAGARKVFMEANLFMPSSNGDEAFDFVEGVQYLAYAISGLQGGDFALEHFGSKCEVPQNASEFTAFCVRSELFHNRELLLANFPSLLAFIGSDSNRWLAFEALLENTTREGVSERPFTKGELVEMLVLLHYVETYFANFDLDSNQLISVDDTLVSFPIFHRSLAEIVRSSFGFSMSEDDLKGLLTFLFRYGRPPQATLGGMLKFLNWRWNPDRWRYDEDRMRVVQILSELNAAR